MQSKFVETPVLPPIDREQSLCANVLSSGFDEARFSFLNQTVSFSTVRTIDWNYAGNGKLWVYNLNYFDFLRQPNLATTTGQELIDSWIAAEATHKDGWEPYPISLRLVNWLQFYRTAQLRVPSEVFASIRRQYAALWRKREFHLGGNHLLENAIALALTARYLNDDAGRAKADKLLLEELNEQYLPDGAHYERSIMYHLMLFWRQLELYSWIGVPGKGAGGQPSDLLNMLEASLPLQLAWAATMITPAGIYPHFNDSTEGIAPSWRAVQNYATSLGLLVPSEGAELANKNGGDGAGYRHWTHNGMDLWIDAGAIGPDYIPGHAHADNLNFVLHLDGVPLIIDPAISTYEKNERRAWERSTKAHNTVTIKDGQNSSDVWGGFRVGKRARTTITTDKRYELTASHTGFFPIIHTRHFSLDAFSGRLTLSDHLSSPAEPAVARLHFAPGYKPEVIGDTIKTNVCELLVEGGSEIKCFEYQAATGWNCLVNGIGVEIHFKSSIKLEIVPFQTE